MYKPLENTTLSLKLNKERISMIDQINSLYELNEVKDASKFLETLFEILLNKPDQDDKLNDQHRQLSDEYIALKIAFDNQQQKLSEYETQIHNLSQQNEELTDQMNRLDIVRKEMISSAEFLQAERDTLKKSLAETTQTLNNRIELTPNQFIIELSELKRNLLEKFMNNPKNYASMVQKSLKGTRNGMIEPINTQDNKTNMVNFIWNISFFAMLGYRFIEYPVSEKEIYTKFLTYKK